MVSKKHKKTCKTLNYVEHILILTLNYVQHILILASAFTGSVSIFAFTSVAGIL